MRKFLKQVFGRLTLVILAFLLQLAISFVLPIVLAKYYPESFGKLFYLFYIILSILAIIFTIKIINSDMPPEGQLIWTIIILFFPVLGISIYFLFVRRRPPRRHKKLLKSVKEESVKYLGRSDEEALKQDLGPALGQFNYIMKTTGLMPYSNTDVKYFGIGEAFCEDLLKELEQAKKYIFMEYFIIEEGKLWNRILDILKQKAMDGVEVRVMYDDFGTMNKLPGNYYKSLIKAGIKCVRFNAFGPIVSAVQNNRDHRKMTIIDGKIGFMSGLNLADEYVNITHPYGHWKDTGIKLTGEAIKNMVIMFLQLYDVQNQQIEEFSQYFDQSTPKINNGYVCPFGDGPKYFYNDYVALNVYLNIINQAKKYLYITTPYLIIDNKLTNALISAAKRGVDVRIITPHIPDKKIIFGITRSSYKALQEGGVKIYEYARGFIHSKQVLCDDDLGIVGTINFDYRSLLHHYECGTLMYKTECLQKMKEDFENLFDISIDMKFFKQRGLTRILCAILKLFTPML